MIKVLLPWLQVPAWVMRAWSIHHKQPSIRPNAPCLAFIHKGRVFIIGGVLVVNGYGCKTCFYNYPNGETINLSWRNALLATFSKFILARNIRFTKSQMKSAHGITQEKQG